MADAVFHVRVYSLADKYLFASLKDNALQLLKASLSKTLDDDTLGDVISEVYDTTFVKDRDERHQVREAVLDMASLHAKSLFEPGPRFGRFKAMAWSNAEFSAELARRMAVGPSVCALLPGSASPAAGLVYTTLMDFPCVQDGMHVEEIVSRVGLKLEEVLKAGDDLMSMGLIYTTVDDSTWAVMDP